MILYATKTRRLGKAGSPCQKRQGSINAQLTRGCFPSWKKSRNAQRGQKNTIPGFGLAPPEGLAVGHGKARNRDSRSALPWGARGEKLLVHGLFNRSNKKKKKKKKKKNKKRKKKKEKKKNPPKTPTPFQQNRTILPQPIPKPSTKKQASPLSPPKKTPLSLTQRK